VGETVVLKTTQKVTTADGTVIPKGTRLIGHVTEAQAHDSAHTDSRLGIAFDRAELKSGQSLSIHSTIESVNPRPDFTASSSMAGNDSIGMPMGGGIAGGRAMGGGRVSGGGVMGGAVERTSVATTSAGRQVSSSSGDTAHATEGIARGSEHVAGNAATHTAAGAHSVAATGHATASSSNRVTTRSTGIPGVMLHSSDSASASGTLSATKKNVHLDSGTQMDLSFAAAGK
jgi:type IV secretory pathway VirB10-like protein